jgi:putative PIN family toxin of toxin-antitoxin system
MVSNTIPRMPHLNIVIDTNIVVSALRSQLGASYKLLALVGTGKFDISVSVALILEYEAAAKRLLGKRFALTAADIDTVLDYVCSVGQQHKIHFLWRPALPDPSDDLVLELAVASNANAIVTYNKTDFSGADRFGIRLLTAHEFPREIGASL